MIHSPIALFVYNRLEHTKRTIESLAINQESKTSDLVIYSDGAKTPEGSAKVNILREYIKSLSGFRSITVVERETNLGLAESIIRGVSEMLTKGETVIVMEDDLVVSKYFLSYMNAGLNRYFHEPRIASIHAWNYDLGDHVPDTFFLRGADCWGWATWRRAWQHFDPDGAHLLSQLESRQLTRTFDLDDSYPYTQMLRDQIAGRNNSWAIRWHASAFLQDMLTLYPGQSLVKNIGQDNSGVHSGPNPLLETEIVEKPNRDFPRTIDVDKLMRKNIIQYLRSHRSPMLIRVKNRIARVFGKLRTTIT